MPRQQRKAACDPCRTSKLACDHEKPTCSRCRARNREGECVYRLAPFKKAKDSQANASLHASPARSRGAASDGNPARSASNGQDRSGPGLLPRHRLYPNPGYLGSSSHTALFGQLGGMGADEATGPHRAVSEAHISHGAQLVEQLCLSLDITACLSLVESWLKTGANLSLAAPFTQTCLLTVRALLTHDRGLSTDAMLVARDLFTHSCRALELARDTTADAFSAQFSQDRVRWETLCLFLVAVSRATMSTRCSYESISSEQQQRHVRRLAMHFADRCLEMCLSLDCLNDLQLVLLYENFILHTLVDGDQSKTPSPRASERCAELTCCCRLRLLAETRRPLQLLVCTRIPSRHRGARSLAPLSSKHPASCVWALLLCRQERVDFSGAPPEDPRKLLSFPPAGFRCLFLE